MDKVMRAFEEFPRDRRLVRGNGIGHPAPWTFFVPGPLRALAHRRPRERAHRLSMHPRSMPVAPRRPWSRGLLSAPTPGHSPRLPDHRGPKLRTRKPKGRPMCRVKPASPMRAFPRPERSVQCVETGLNGCPRHAQPLPMTGSLFPEQTRSGRCARSPRGTGSPVCRGSAGGNDFRHGAADDAGNPVSHSEVWAVNSTASRLRAESDGPALRRVRAGASSHASGVTSPPGWQSLS